MLSGYAIPGSPLTYRSVSYTHLVKENDAKSILNATYNYDIRFKNETTLDDQKPLLTKEKIQAICKISGVKSVESVTSTEAVVPYQKEVYGEFYKELYQSRYTPGGDYEEDMESYQNNPAGSRFTTRLVGIDQTEFQRINKAVSYTHLIKRSVLFVNLISAGTRSPAENRTRSPTTNSSVGISINSPSRLTVTLS